MSQPQQQYILGKEHALATQVQVLLNIVDKIEGCLSTEHSYTGASKTALDGGAKSSLETTLIQTCNRLDSLLTQKRNWGTNDQNEVLKAIVATHKAQTEFLVSQKLSADEVRRPSFQLRPKLVRVELGFAAIHGDFTSPDEYILGTGETPEAALLDFDEAFKRKPSEQSLLIQPSCSKNPTTGAKPKSNSSKKPS